MSNIGHNLRLHFVGNLAENAKIDGARIGGGAADNQFGAIFFGQIADLIVIDPPGFVIQSVRNNLEKLTGKIDRRAMG